MGGIELTQFYGDLKEIFESEVYWYVPVVYLDLVDYQETGILSLRGEYVSAYTSIEDILYLKSINCLDENILLIFARQRLQESGFKEVSIVEEAKDSTEKDRDDIEEYRVFEDVGVEAKGYVILQDRNKPPKASGWKKEKDIVRRIN